MKEFTTIADTACYGLELDGRKYILISDNGGESGMVYKMGTRIRPIPRDSGAWGCYFDGQVIGRSSGQNYGPPTKVGVIPLPDEVLPGYIEMKSNPTFVFRNLGEDN